MPIISEHIRLYNELERYELTSPIVIGGAQTLLSLRIIGKKEKKTIQNFIPNDTRNENFCQIYWIRFVFYEV